MYDWERQITGNVFVDFMISSTGKVKNVQESKPVYPHRMLKPKGL
jgi:hypothetical protein